MRIEYYEFGLKYPALQHKIFNKYRLFNSHYQGTVAVINEAILQSERDNILRDVRRLLDEHTPHELEKMNTLESLKQTSLNGEI